MVVPADNEIYRGDSYVYADVTVQSVSTVVTDQPFVTADSDQPQTSLTVEEPANPLVLEAGYDAYGTSRVNLHFPVESDAEPADQVSRIQVIGDAVYEYNGNGTMLTESMGNTATYHPMTAMTSYDGTITDGVVTDDEVLFRREATSYNRLPGNPGGVAPRVVRQLPGSRVEVTQTHADPAGARMSATAEGSRGGNGRLTHVYEKRGEYYVLQEMRSERDDVVNGRGVRTSRVVRFKNVRWHKNREKDRARKEHRERAVREHGPMSPVAQRRSYTSPADECQVYDYQIINECDGGGGGGGGGGILPRRRSRCTTTFRSPASWRPAMPRPRPP